MRTRLIVFLLLILNVHSPGQLYINEFLSANVNGILDEDGEYQDWIEIYNGGGSSVGLSGYGLTDDIILPAKWTFPAMSIESGGHVLVFASGKDRKNLALTYQTIIDIGDTWRYLVPDTDIGTTWHGQGFDDSSWDIGNSGFGYADDDDNTVLPSGILSVFIRKEFMITDLAHIQQLFLHIDYDDGFVAYINGMEVARANIGSPGEIVPFDATTETDHEANIYQGGSPSLFEINDPASVLVEGTNVISIQGHNVGNTSSDLTLIPFLSVGTSSGLPNSYSTYLSFPEGGGLHTNFKIKSAGESFYLFNASGTLLDSSSAVSLLPDISCGRKPDGGSQWLFFAEPTPGSANSTSGVQELMANPVYFNPMGGKHTGGLSITLSTDDPNDTIYYTTNGSIPTKSSSRYTSSIYIGSNRVIRARVIKSTCLPGPVSTNTYVTQYDHQIPIVCLSTEPDNLWDDYIGIYVLGPTYEQAMPHYGANYWEEWERPIHFELFDTDGIKRIDQVSGTKIFGGWSRTSDQKSQALFARSIYGKGSFEYQFFKDKPIDKFETLVLRNSGNDNMQLQFHDCFMTGLTRDMDADRQAYQPVAAYLNGQYWGLLNIREKVNEHFIAENHNVDPESVNLLEYEKNVIYGTNADYIDILNHLKTYTTLQSTESYEWMKERIDIDNYIQYQLTQIYLNNTDWPGNNIKYWNTTAPGSKFRWILFDTDFGFGMYGNQDYELNTLEFALEPYGPGWPNPPWSTLLFRRLVTNQEFRYNFINQYCDRLNVDFKPSRVSADLDSIRDLYYTDMGFHFNRWWGSYEDWEARINRNRTFGNLRPAYARQHMQSVFNLGNEMNIHVNVSDPKAGKVKVNTVYPYSYPFTGVYFEDIPITLTAYPKPGYKFVSWEGDAASTDEKITYDMSSGGSFTAVFEEAGVNDISIVINEINYNSSPDRDTKDWIELMNNGSTTIDLEGWLISDSGIDTGHYFQPGIYLSPGEYLVVCRDLSAFRQFNPNIANAIGNIPFGLSSNGDIIRVYDDQGTLMDAVDYYPWAPWPENANGTGASIELIEPSLDNTLGENWRASGIGGTPGRPNTGLEDIGLQPVLQIAGFECFPNPFRDFTTIQFSVSEEADYRLEVLDINGQVMNILAHKYLVPGSYSVDWFGNNQSGTGLSKGIYIVRLSSDKEIQTIKVIMLK